MQKIQKLKLCDWSLALMLPLMLASALQLELTGSRGLWPVVIHCLIGLGFMATIVWHIYLHFGWKKWLNRFGKLKPPTRILWWLYVLTFLSGLATAIHWGFTQTHTPLGGVHGKIGLLMLAFALGHTLKRLKFFKKRVEIKR